MRILHVYNHLEECHSLLEFQLIKIEGLEQHVGELEHMVIVSEIDAVTMEVTISTYSTRWHS